MDRLLYTKGHQTNKKGETMNKVYQIITDRIIAALEKDIIPWRSGWAGSMNPANAVSGKAYNGINKMLLWQEMGSHGSPWFVTSKQAQSLGGRVKNSEWRKSSLVTYWKVIETENVVEGENGEEPVKKMSKHFMLRYYSVWNVNQCENIRLPKHCKQIEESYNERLPKPQEVFDTYLERTGIRMMVGSPSYSPKQDVIRMPDFSSYETAERYYKTSFHEMVHSTGHSSRLNRFLEMTYFGSEGYSKEELVAEIGASFLCNHTQIDDGKDLFENSVSYISGWLSVLRNDPKMIVSAASKAQKAVDFILGEEA